MTSKHRNTVTTALAVAITAALVVAPAAYSAGKPSGRAAAAKVAAPAADSYDEFIVSYRAGKQVGAAAFDRGLASASKALGLNLTAGATLGTGARMVHTGRKLDRVEQKELMHELSKDPSVLAVEANVYLQRAGTAVPNDPRYAEQWHYKPGGINAEGAWGAGYDGTGVSVGIIDTGALVHADLPAITGGYDFITDPTNGNDGNGRDTNPADPGDWLGSDPSSWHGAHVHGTIGARTNNALGVAGVAPGATVEHLRVLGTQGGSLQDIADAIVWASGGNVAGITSRPERMDIVNLSLGGAGACAAVLQTAINQAEAAGTIVVVAAGNSSGDVANFQPANCNDVVTVAGTGPNNTRYAATNFGEEIEVAAPGGSGVTPATNQVLSTVNSGTQAPVASPGGDAYAWYAGTSMAAPHVSATIALMLEADPSLEREEIVRILRATGFATNQYVTGCSTASAWCSYLIDASDAVAVADGSMTEPPAPPAGPPPPPPPTPLQNGVATPVGNLTLNQELFYSIAVPADATQLIVTFASPTGSSTNDADLRVRFNAVPAVNTYDCRSWNVGTAERCAWGNAPTPVIGPIQTGTYNIRVDGYTAATGYVLTATHNGTGGGGGEPPSGLAVASNFALKGNRHRVVLTWEDGGEQVAIRFNGAAAATVANNGYFAHTFTQTGSGNSTYQICNAGSTTACSATITVPYAPR